MSRTTGYVVCPRCGRTVKGYVPKDGDGSHLRPYRHQNLATWTPTRAALDCDGRFSTGPYADPPRTTTEQPDDRSER